MKKIMDFQKVRVTYPSGFCAVRGVNFAVAEGECLAIVGESGSGKTTIARAALGLLPEGTEIEGSIKISETEVIGAGEKILRNLRGLVVGFVAQDPYSSFNPLTRIYNHVAEAWRVHALKPPVPAIVDSLKRLGIKSPEKTSRMYPHEWSGGMLQRATIVAAQAHQPKLIVADEPTSALDANRADEILTALRPTGAAVLLISHDINLVAKHASRIAVCYQGEIVETGKTRQIIENPQHYYTKKLISAAIHEKISVLIEESSEIVLEAKNASQFYGDKQNPVAAVSGVNLQVRRGEIVGIYGNSGCGKSTLLRMLATIETPDQGEIYLGGELATNGENKKLSGKKSRSGFVMPIFQDPLASLDRRWAIWRTVAEPLTAKHLTEKPSREKRREIARSILEKVGLPEIDLDAKPNQLSIGQCQRVAIARALLAKPALIVADEPTSALDASVSKTILRLLSQIAESGTAIVIVSHDTLVLNSLCHRVLQMHEGVLSD